MDREIREKAAEDAERQKYNRINKNNFFRLLDR